MGADRASVREHRLLLHANRCVARFNHTAVIRLRENLPVWLVSTANGYITVKETKDHSPSSTISGINV